MQATSLEDKVSSAVSFTLSPGEVAVDEGTKEANAQGTPVSGSGDAIGTFIESLT